MKMRIFWKHLFLCTLITLFSRNAADKSPPYDGTLVQNENSSQDDDSNDYRLPNTVKPLSYDIKFIPDLESSFTFKGYAKIVVEALEEINNVTLHVGNIKIELITISSYDLKNFNETYDNTTEKLTLHLPKTIKKGRKLEINFEYTGILSDNMIGFYRSSYIENGTTKWLAATQFQTTHARHAFPCFDEPNYKATFTIRIARGTNYVSLSNMPLLNSEQLAPGGKIWDVFEQTVPMPTYLVAFVISEFKNYSNEANNFTVWSKPSTINQTNYALDIGIRALELFHKKFNQEYVLPKMDMIAVPDFSAGAMENWGLVTYRESRMLYDEEESSALAQQSVASVIAHELTHMWFGNLVTPEWWSYLWLSEGFARYFQYFGTAELEDKWDMDKQFVVEQHQSALIADSVEPSLPMTRPVLTTSQIAGVGDTITYNKGASIIRMMNLIFGPEKFKMGLQAYIRNSFYRVNYDHNGWKRIFNALTKIDNLDDIHVLNRAALVDDLLNLGRAGYQDNAFVLENLLYLKRETNYLPFKAAFNGLEYFNKRFSGSTDEHFLFKLYVLVLLEEVRFKLGYEDRDNDDRLTILLRREVNNWACNFDDDECVTNYRNKFTQWKANDNLRIKPNERTTAYCVAVKHGSYEDWEFLWNEYKNSNHAADQVVILNALGCSQNKTILEKYLKYAITPFETSKIRKQDSTTVFAAVYNSGLLGAEYILDFVEKYHKDLENYYGGQSTIASILDGASQRFSTSYLVNKFEDFISKHKADFVSIQKSLDYSLKVAKYELSWHKTNSKSMIPWLRTYIENVFRIPSNIEPKKYDITIKPHFENFTFDGKVKIEAEVIKPTTKIVLHSSEIKNHEVNVTKVANNKTMTIRHTKIDKPYDFFIIYLNTELTTGKILIDITYKGHLNATELRGFYKSSYVDNDKNTRWLAASHLEPVGARKMFPCFDEPAKKAEFIVQVSVPRDYTAISNMDWRNIEKVEGRLLYSFYKTVKMSTYLVAVIVSDFACKTVKTDNPELSVCARPNAISQTEYASSVMHPLVEFFETTYNQSYQLPKLSMAALPDFGSGAMENWGLLTYREASMLYDENHSPITNKQSIRNVIAHEISHQWFGNLVSPLWWSYLWLNEGFARYFEYFAPARTFNDTTMDSQFVVDQIHSAFSVDSSISTHPMSHDVMTVPEIRGIFDTITYAKGASILRMIEKTYGIKIFNDALINYLNERKYEVATPEDLYKSLQKYIQDRNITTVLNTWTRQSGYPVVNVRVTNTVVFMMQERFFLKKNNSNTMWHIPITWTTVQNSSEDFDTTPKLWLTTKAKRIEMSSQSPWIFNIQQSGYYRVNYNEKHWMDLIDYLNHEDFETIHEINRAALIDDLMNLARANYTSYKTVISATMYLQRETNYFPWRAFFNNLPYLEKRFAGRDIESLYKEWLTLLVKQLYTQLGFEDNGSDNDLTKMLRIYARNWACKLDVADCKFYAAKYLQKKQHSRTIPPNYRDVVYCTAMRSDKTINTYNFLWKEYLNSNVHTDKLVILNALACSENKIVLEKLLRDAVAENSPIRYQDSAKVFSSVYDASLIGVEVVMQVIEKYYDDILRQHFYDYTKIGNIVSALASRLSTSELYNQYQKLLTWLVDKEPEFETSVQSYLATAKYEFDWYDKNVPVIFETLDNLFPHYTYRLPKTLHPKLYNIDLTPDMEKGTFEGTVEIKIAVRESTSLIVLNSHHLTTESNIKVFRDNLEIKLLNHTKRIPQQQIRLYLSEYLHVDEEVTVKINFNGTLNDNMNGFYRSSYFDQDGKLHWLATTQFEPTYARQAFPCFDEPAFKSKFTINIQKLKKYNALSNMPVNTTASPKPPKNENYTWVTFQTSVEMSSYLVAFVISEFKSAKPENAIVNVWGRPEVIKHGNYAQDIGKKIINALENFTNINYALRKLDLVGIPDFSNGAMENWGLATFREYGLFYDKNEITASSERYLITVIAHELTHMWFGNLVTCEWWDYIWLNEGFAQYFESFISDRILPDYKFMDQFVVYELQAALSEDDSLSAHPMTNPVETPEEIADVFDYVTYGKSASVLRMMFNAFDEEIHLKALRNYLTKRQYKTSRPTDLWESFESLTSVPINEERNASVEEVMNTWTNQPGYPIVTATLDGFLLTLTQERFLMDRNVSSDEFYWIPIEIFVPADYFNSFTLKHKFWLGAEPVKTFINPTNDWFIVNYKQTGFYRVNYDAESWQRLITKLNNKEFEAIDVLNRAQIVDDLFNLARAGYVDYELLLNATKYLKQETNHLPWKAFFNGLSYVYERFENTIFQHNLSQYVLNLLSNMTEKINFIDNENDKHLDKLNRELILQWTCKLNQHEYILKSVELFKAWRNDSSKRIPINARPAVYCTALKYGTPEDWEFLWKQYLTTNFATEKKIIIKALGCSTNREVLQRYLKEAIEIQKNPANSKIRRQDVSAVFSSVYSTGSIGVNVTLDFLLINVRHIHSYFDNWDDVASLLVNVASHVSSEYQRDKVLLFVELYSDLHPPSAREKLFSAINTAETNLIWLTNNGPKIREWITKLQPQKGNSSPRIESFNVISMIFIALISYFLSYY
ncbi:putative aminopeptidase-2 [Pogonomyrmex barbatus]|uniref:Aminopeptidase-2 n=1 Tax=Pogonomyrmex barbatus TaxID=144034 RepID=A0A6I9WN34_9HYME|nr:putative aminopeptidase-2 [Pogonomyrmex barbatus]